MPTVGILVLALAVAGLPFGTPAVSATEGVLRWILWAAAGLALLYVAVRVRRIAGEYGLRAALKWLLTGSVPSE